MITDVFPNYKQNFARNRGEAKFPGFWKGLVSSWEPFLGPTGNRFVDQGAYKNHGTLNNTTWGVDQSNYSLDFETTNNAYADCGNDASLQILGDLTLGCWVKINSIIPSTDFFNFGNLNEAEANNILYLFRLVATGDLFIGHEYSGGINQFTTLNTNLSTGQYYFLILVRDTKVKKYTLYIDGVAFGTTYTYTNDPTGGNTSQLRIGTNEGLTAFMDATLKSSFIYNRVLQKSEIILLSNIPYIRYIKKDLTLSPATLTRIRDLIGGFGIIPFTR